MTAAEAAIVTIQHLDDIEQRLALATNVEDVAGATLQLLARLREDLERPRPPAVETLRQLVSEAFSLLNDESSPVDRRDWNREARKWL